MDTNTHESGCPWPPRLGPPRASSVSRFTVGILVLFVLALSLVSRAETSIRARWQHYPYPSRPFTLRNFRLLMARHPIAEPWRKSGGFNHPPSLRYHPRRGHPRPVAGHLQALWHIGQPGDYSFDASEREVCWFLFVDGRPVANWMDDDATTALQPGLHAVDFFVFVGTRERLPVPLVRQPDDAYAPLSPVAWDTEAGTNSSALPWSGWDEVPEGAARVLIDGAMSAPERIFDTKNRQNAEAPAFWRRLVAVEASARILDTPLLVASESSLAVTVRVNVGNRFAALVGESPTLQVVTRKADGGWRKLASQAVTSGDDQVRLRFDMPAPATELAVCLRNGERDLVTPIPLVCLSSATFGPEVDFVGGVPHSRGRRAVFVLDDQPVPGKPKPPFPPPKVIALLDDVWEPVFRPENGASDLQFQFTKTLSVAVRHLTPVSQRQAGIPATVAKFAMVSEALAMLSPGDIAVLAVGGADLEADRRVSEVVRELEFLARACRSCGVRPVLVTPLPDAGENPPRTRRLALSTKELAARIDCPVADFFSAARLVPQQNTDDSWMRQEVRRAVFR